MYNDQDHADLPIDDSELLARHLLSFSQWESLVQLLQTDCIENVCNRIKPKNKFWDASSSSLQIAINDEIQPAT